MSTGLLLMIVGMGTVFCVLGLVVATGKFLILSVNRFHPAIIETSHISSVIAGEDSSGAKIAAITGAVDVITGGKGRITHIERLNE
jgi:oxaloacetate decarboxylase gamma subunit